MRTKKALYNNIVAAILQFTTLLFGLFVPRLMIHTYGSELNGLISTTRQMISYLAYFELGITSALIFTLFKPVALNDYMAINPIVSRAKKEYDKIGKVYFLGVVLIASFYPFVVDGSIKYTKVFLIILILGIYGTLDFMTLSKYRVLLEANQKAYVINLATLATVIIQNSISILLINLSYPVVYVISIPVILLPIRSIILNKYIKNVYPKIDYSTVPMNTKLTNRKDSFINGLASSLNVSLPIVIISLVVSLEMASVFSIYSLVFMGLSGIINVFITGMKAAFGNIYAKNERDLLLKANDYYEFLLYIIIAIVYSTSLAMIIPFIRVYIEGISDINYIYPVTGTLFTIWSVAYTSRIPNQTLINATGKWELITKINILQIVLLFLLSFIFGLLWGVNGVLVGMVIATILKTVTVLLKTNKNILLIKSKKSLHRILRIFIIIFICNAPRIFNVYLIQVNSFIEWIFSAVLHLGIFSVVSLTLNYVLERKLFHEIIERYRIIISNFLKNK